MPHERDFMPEDELLDAEDSAEFGYEEDIDVPEDSADAEEPEFAENRERVFEGHGYRLEGDVIRDEKGDAWTNGDPTLAGALNGLKTEGGGMLFVDTVAKEIDGGTEFFHTYYTVDTRGNVSFFIDREVVSRADAEEVQPALAEDPDESFSSPHEVSAYEQPQLELEAEEQESPVLTEAMWETPFSYGAGEVLAQEERHEVSPRAEAQPAAEVPAPEMTRDLEIPPSAESTPEPRRESATHPAEKAQVPEAVRESVSPTREIPEPENRRQAPDVWLTHLLATEPLPLGAEDVGRDPTPETDRRISDARHTPEDQPAHRDQIQERPHPVQDRESPPVSVSVPRSEPAAHARRIPEALTGSPLRLVREQESRATEHAMEEAKDVPAPVVRPVRAAQPERSEDPGSSRRAADRDVVPRVRVVPPEIRAVRSIVRTAERDMPAELPATGSAERALVRPRTVESSRRRTGTVNTDEDSQNEEDASRVRLRRDGIMMEIAA